MHLEIFGIQVPYEDLANVTNSVASIKAQSSVCQGLYARKPNVILVSSLLACVTCMRLLTRRMRRSWTTSTREMRWVPRLPSMVCENQHSVRNSRHAH